MQKTLLVFLLAFMVKETNAQFVKLQSGIEYRYIKKGTSKQTAKVGDFMTMIIKSTCSGQVLFDSKSINKSGLNSPVNFPLQKPSYNGDVNDVLKYLHAGDSVVVKIPQDSFYRVPQAQRKNLIAGEPVIYSIGVYSIYTAAQLKKMQEDYNKALAENAKQQALFKKQQATQLALQKIQAALDKKQDVELNTYFKNNNIVGAKKSASGIYILTEKEGSGDNIKASNEVALNIEKYLLNGKKIESNIDTTFPNNAPLKVTVGQRQLIAGLDEGLLSFKKGGKGKIFIPSKFGYGSMKYPIRQNDTIPANSVLQVDIEILDIVDPIAATKLLVAKEDSTIQTFLKANNLNATKTASGMYYIITQEGTGANPAVGDTVNMNYTGMYLDGNKFDSNVDSAFNHVQPLVFPLGQGRVIQGWDEGIQLLKKGTKAKFIIPSRIGYCVNGKGNIAPNTIMQFDVELLDFKKAVPAKKLDVPKK